MKIDGRLIAEEIKERLKKEVASLSSQNITPHLAVILVGNNPSSLVYIRQKKKVGEEIGVKVVVYNLSKSDKDTSDGVQSTPPRWRNLKDKLINLVNKLNSDPSVHGIIIQRPLPIDIGKDELDRLVIPKKDVDGFHPESPFTPPVALAVIKILEWVSLNSPGRSPYGHLPGVAKRFLEGESWEKWLKNKRILVIGRGETAGRPIAETLKKITDKITIAHSKTANLKEVCLASDIIISCVGKRPILRRSKGRPQNGPFIVRHDMVSPDTLLIGVGLHQENGKLATDYDQKEIAGKVAFYTPVPGGVGPVNVACLMENLIFATKSLFGNCHSEPAQLAGRGISQLV
ncbi:bifunctional 5,10-methylenetetrahydrofolate dehydrogenase/5,10-methenyltetrahydrofolate cyclohydrolase [Candidatus Gottesmanbacteria bacterium]|nr:bifunctional 5,10-methylenetetrahydrofolate dehydrogenase/5,10-methenyltetrahydrofolate cyclohydrolase [Candidatus Gottesmanbacteria bacterium]